MAEYIPDRNPDATIQAARQQWQHDHLSEAMAAHLIAAGFPAGDVQVLGPKPNKGNLVVCFRARAVDRKPILLLAHFDVVEAEPADWTLDPFTFVEQDGYYYGRGTSDDKDEATI